VEAAGTSVRLVMKALLLSARWAERRRRLGLEQAARASADSARVLAENLVLPDRVEFLTEQLACAQRRLQAANLRMDHLKQLLADFTLYYNAWRPHTTLKGVVPGLIHAGQHWSAPPKTAKLVPAHIERRFFPETRVTGFRLAAWWCARRALSFPAPERAAHPRRSKPSRHRFAPVSVLPRKARHRPQRQLLLTAWLRAVSPPIDCHSHSRVPRLLDVRTYVQVALSG
jgi:hypothetical protein